MKFSMNILARARPREIIRASIRKTLKRICTLKRKEHQEAIMSIFTTDLKARLRIHDSRINQTSDKHFRQIVFLFF